LKHQEIFKTERLLIRKLQYGDAASIFNSYASDPISTRYISWLTHQSIEDTNVFLKNKIENWGNDSDHPYAIFHKDSNDFIGSIGFVNENGRVFIGYIIVPKMEGNGYASEAAKCIVQYLASRNEYYRIWACCALENKASSRVLENAGMIREALIAKWVSFPNLNNKSLDCYFYYYPLF